MVGRRRHPGTVRGRTTLAASVVVAATLAVGGVALDTLLRSKLIDNVEQVAELRAEDVAALAASGDLPDPLGVEDDAVVQVVDGGGRVVASSANVRGAPPLADLRPPAEDGRATTIDGGPGLSGEFRLVAIRASSPTGPVTVYVGAAHPACPARPGRFAGGARKVFGANRARVAPMARQGRVWPAVGAAARFPPGTSTLHLWNASASSACPTPENPLCSTR